MEKADVKEDSLDVFEEKIEGDSGQKLLTDLLHEKLDGEWNITTILLKCRFKQLIVLRRKNPTIKASKM